MQKRCYIRIGNQYLKDAHYCSSLSEAQRHFVRVARKVKGPMIAEVYYIDDNTRESVSMFPDVRLTIGPKKGLITEHLEREDITNFGGLE